MQCSSDPCAHAAYISAGDSHLGCTEGIPLINGVNCRLEPLSVTNGLDNEEHDQEGRLITAEYSTHYG